jgi:hypothetical protein
LTIWDRLHGTLHVNIPQQSVAIGVPRFDGDEDVALGRMLALPFSGADVTPLEQPSHAIESVPPGTLVP